MDSSIPSIFNKKLNKSNIKLLNYIQNDTGRMKHFPPAAQEWYNSVYAYNNNYIKGLPASDKSLMNLLKGYFSMFISHNVLNTKYVSKLYRKRSPKKIFLGKGELKHTSTKVIITLYVYNTEKISLKREYKQLYLSLFSPIKKGNKSLTYLKKPLEKQIVLDKEGNILKDITGNDIIIYNRPYTLEEFINSPKYITTKINETFSNTRTINETFSDAPIFKQITYYDVYSSIVELFVDNLSSYLTILNKYFEYLTKLVELKILNDHEKFLIFISLVNNYYYNYPNYEYYKKIANRKYIQNLYRLRYLLKFNNVKFEKPFIRKLIDLVENLYNKKVEFNIVNLNQVHLNSDILTQAVVLKLKNKKNKFYKIFKSSLNKVKISDVSRLSQKIDVSNKKNYFINDIRNVYINDMLNNKIVKGDSLNKLLLNYFPSANKLEIEDLYGVEQSISLKDYIFRYLKHFRLGGVRLEARGRLSRRFTASRSVFKLNWKGGLKNVDSSFKGLSTVMIRGNIKSNVEYSMVKSKYRIGAFGVKGWVSSK